MNLLHVLDEFVSTFQRSPEKGGELSFEMTPAPVESELPLNDDLKTYFAHVRFEDSPQIGGRLNLFLFSQDELIGAQHGWRWIREKSGETIEDVTYWRPTWIVIADKNGDAIFVDTENNRVLGSIQKRNFLVAKTLARFFDALTAVMKIEMDDYDFDVLSEDMAPLPQFLDDVRAAVSARLEDEETAGFMKFFFG